MDRWKFFNVISTEHFGDNPMSERKAEQLIELLKLPEGGRVLDTACGKGQMLVRAAQRWGVSGVGVDLSPYAVARSPEAVAAAGLTERITITEGDGAESEAPPESFEAGICLGASWIWGGHTETVAAMARWTKPGVLVLVGEPFWRREPSAGYLEATGMSASDFGTHLGNVEAGEAAGLRILHSHRLQ